jgi:WXG100 family type VII secretion target
MDKPIAASPEKMTAAATQVGFHTDEVSLAHATALEQVEGSLSGWVGESANALDAVGGRWRTATQRHVERLDALGAHMRTTAAGFDQVDAHNAADIKHVGDAARDM